MKHLFIILFLWLSAVGLYAQNNPFSNMNNGQFDQFNGQDPNKPDSATMAGTDRQVPVSVKAWTVDEHFGNIRPAVVDTLRYQFMNKHFTEGVDGEYNILGNTGSPRYARIFMDRASYTQNVFAAPYDFFLFKPEQFMFYNTKSPYTNITYDWCGDKRIGDDRLRFLLTINANKRLNVGFRFDYLYGRGYYNNQATSFFNGTFFTSYTGDKYQMHLFYGIDHLKMQENAGIIDDRWILNPEQVSTQNVQSQDITTTFSEPSWNRQHMNNIFLSHRYNIGFYKTEKLKNESDPSGKDSIRTVRTLVPVTSFIHTLRIQSNDRRYIAYTDPYAIDVSQTPHIPITNSHYYENYYLKGDSTRDETKYLSVKNTFAIELIEGFNKWAQAGLTAFVSHEYRKFDIPDTLSTGTLYRYKSTDHIISVGGQLARTKGKHLNYSVLGETALSGSDIGTFNIEGTADLKFRLRKDTVDVGLKGYVRNQAIPYLWKHFHGKNFWWDNDGLSKEFRTHIEGMLSLRRTGTTLRVGIDNIKNFTYFQRKDKLNSTTATDGTVSTSYLNNVELLQNGGNIQVINLQVKQDLKFGPFNFNNTVTFQKSSSDDALPLPLVNVYSNLFFDFRLFRVLDMQIGADARFFTKYYTYDYSPEIGQYMNQDAATRMKIGNYPIVNAYINCQLKRMRFYIMMSHISQGMGNKNEFYAPHYPINPRILKFGLSWNLFN